MKAEDVSAFVDKTGGPANPADIAVDEGGSLTFPGLLMRDWFAGRAMASLLNTDIAHAYGNEFKEQWCEIVARNAYIYADAMLKERAK